MMQLGATFAFLLVLCYIVVCVESWTSAQERFFQQQFHQQQQQQQQYQRQQQQQQQQQVANANPSAVLGTLPGDTREYITHRYKELSKLWHPDKCASFNACSAERKAAYEERMIAINAAYSEALGAAPRTRRGKRGHDGSWTDFLLFWIASSWDALLDVTGASDGLGLGLGLLYKIAALVAVVWLGLEYAASKWVERNVASGDKDPKSASAPAPVRSSNPAARAQGSTDEDILGQLFPALKQTEAAAYLSNYGDVLAAIDAVLASAAGDGSDRQAKRTEAKVLLRQRRDLASS